MNVTGVAVIKIVVANDEEYWKAKSVQFLSALERRLKRREVQGTTVLVPIAEKHNMIDRLVVTNLVAEPINIIKAVLVMDRAVALATKMNICECCRLIQLTTKFLNVQFQS